MAHVCRYGSRVQIWLMSAGMAHEYSIRIGAVNTDCDVGAGSHNYGGGVGSDGGGYRSDGEKEALDKNLMMTSLHKNVHNRKENENV
ncbi:Hypothetical predicted protein [Octopus vulgaris]|uniref:Uncharacterized protein n=1 Tax=Octopus vulgaris TaxID=6645 RepID=A0AA36AS08_OCTVU|nr:Hypothetical predicted protein [Octopus vulgaris]